MSRVPPIPLAPPSAQRLVQQAVDQAETATGALGVGGLIVQVAGPSMGVVDARQRENVYRFLAQVVSSGPNGEADYSDERYWVRGQFAAQQAVDRNGVPIFAATAAVTLQPETGFEGAEWTTATNVAEIAAHSHSLPVDGSVYLWVEMVEGQWGGDPTQGMGFPQFVFHCPLGGGARYCVKQNGGSQADGTNFASFTYDCYQLADKGCTGSALSGGPFAVLNSGSSSYSEGSAARIAPWGVTPAPTGSTAELVTVGGTQYLRGVGETVIVQNCTP